MPGTIQKVDIPAPKNIHYRDIARDGEWAPPDALREHTFRELFTMSASDLRSELYYIFRVELDWSPNKAREFHVVRWLREQLRVSGDAKLIDLPDDPGQDAVDEYFVVCKLTLAKLVLEYETLCGTGSAKGLRKPVLVEKVVHIRLHHRESEESRASASLGASARPGINEDFQGDGLEAEHFLERFEVEDRELFQRRGEICRMLGDSLKDHSRPLTVVDVGCGTGAFMDALAEILGPQDTLIMSDTASKFAAMLQQKAAGLMEKSPKCPNIRVHTNTASSLLLERASCDAVFMVDSYHHVEFPDVFMNDVRHCLKPSGRLMVIDFEKIDGVSTEWVMGHVRAPKEVALSEITSAGFDLVLQRDNWLKQNWISILEPSQDTLQKRASTSSSSAADGNTRAGKRAKQKP